jgi:hypothetical protein
MMNTLVLGVCVYPLIAFFILEVDESRINPVGGEESSLSETLTSEVWRSLGEANGASSGVERQAVARRPRARPKETIEIR